MDHVQNLHQKIKTCILACLGVTVLVILDQITKSLAVRYLNPQNGGEDRILLNGIFRLRYLENHGAAFGILQDRKILLILVTVVVFAVLLVFFARIPNERHFRPLQWVTVFVMAGAIGNFIDRIRLGYVIDFFYFEWINFPIFNVADIYVTCSVILFLVLFLFCYKEKDIDRILSFRKKGEA